MQRAPNEIIPAKSSAELTSGDRITIRFESLDGNVTTVILPAKMMQRLNGEIGTLLEPKKVQRSWGTGLTPDVAAKLPQTNDDAEALGEILPAPGVGRLS